MIDKPKFLAAGDAATFPPLLPPSAGCEDQMRSRAAIVLHEAEMEATRRLQQGAAVNGEQQKQQQQHRREQQLRCEAVLEAKRHRVHRGAAVSLRCVRILLLRLLSLY